MGFFQDLFGTTARRAQEEQQRLAQQQQADIQAREDKRQADIRAGQGQIDSAFSQFNPGYYDAFKQTYVSNYLPQIGNQFDIAKGKTTATLADKGMLESTVGANEFGKLQKTRNDAEAQVGNDAADAANQLKSNVENTKSNLFGLNLQAADPASIGAQAQAQAGAVVSPAAFPRIGDVFGAAVQPIATFNRADAGSMNPQLPWNQFRPTPTSGRGNAVFG